MAHFDLSIDGLNDEDRAHLAQANAAIDFLTQARVNEVRAADYTGNASWGLASYRQVWLFRVVHLADGICAEWNAGRFINAAVLLRSLIETVAAFSHALDHGYVLLRDGKLREFHERVMKAMFGSNETRAVYPDMPSPTNVRTMVDQLDKCFKGVRKHYDGLSELVHPNAAGGLAFTDMKFDEAALQLSETHENLREVVWSILAGLSMLEHAEAAYRGSESVIMPIIADLEKKHGPHADSWPKTGA